jgi:hypothetical protein
MRPEWLIIGSTAAYHWYADWRRPIDLDVLTKSKVSGFGVVDGQWHEVAQDIIERSTDKVFADPSILHTLKVSHAYWDIHWKKTMYDIHQFQVRGAGFHQDLHDRLVKVWTGIHGAKKVNLNQTKDTFWKDNVKRKYDHEWLHTLVAFHSTPLHERLHVSGHPIMMDKGAFFDLPLSLQLDTALEEILVLAIERGELGVQSSKVQRLVAFDKAHFTLCTSAAKGWFAQFLVQQAHTLKVTLREHWLQQLKTALQLLPKDEL